MAQNWPYSENLSKLRICQILIFFLFSDRFYDGNKYLSAYNHLIHESYWFWSLLNFHDFRHYIYYSIYTKCQIGKAKPSPRTERFSVLESLGPMEWETGVTAIDFKLFLFCATLDCLPCKSVYDISQKLSRPLCCNKLRQGRIN